MPIAIPDIRFLFTGLLAFRKYGSDHFDVGVHSQAGHEFHIAIIERSPASPDPIDLEVAVLGSEISFEVENPVYPGVSTYTNGRFNRVPILDDERDFRWAIQLDGPGFHDRRLKVRAGIFTPILHMNNGIFYAAKKSLIQKIQPMTSVYPRGEVPLEATWFVGADVFLGETGDRATLTYGGGGGDSYLFTKGPNKMYLVLVWNLAPPGHASNSMHSDFKFYYDAYDVPLQDQFDIKGVSSYSAQQTEVQQSGFTLLGKDAVQLAKDALAPTAFSSAALEVILSHIFGSYFRPCIPIYLSTSSITPEP